MALFVTYILLREPPHAFARRQGCWGLPLAYSTLYAVGVFLSGRVHVCMCVLLTTGVCAVETLRDTFAVRRTPSVSLGRCSDVRDSFCDLRRAIISSSDTPLQSAPLVHPTPVPVAPAPSAHTDTPGAAAVLPVDEAHEVDEAREVEEVHAVDGRSAAAAASAAAPAPAPAPAADGRARSGVKRPAAAPGSDAPAAGNKRREGCVTNLFPEASPSSSSPTNTQPPFKAAFDGELARVY